MEEVLQISCSELVFYTCKTLEIDGEEIIVNLDYVLRLREYPKNKRGKRKSVITD